MANNMHIQISEISKKIERGISVTDGRIAKLKKLGLIERTGQTKADVGAWLVAHTPFYDISKDDSKIELDFYGIRK